MTSLPARLLDAIVFAAHKHRDQRRKDETASPYINHPIALAHLLATTGGIDDIVVLQAAIRQPFWGGGGVSGQRSH